MIVVQKYWATGKYKMTPPVLKNALFVDYIYLDIEERRKMNNYHMNI